MAMSYDKRLGQVIRGGRRRLYSLEVSAIFASASHRAVQVQVSHEPGRVRLGYVALLSPVPISSV